MPEQDPFRLRVQKALVAALEQVSGEGLGSVDFTGRVYRGRDIFGNSDAVPMISILESIVERDNLSPPPAGSSTRTVWELLVQGWTKDDEDHPTDPAQHLLARVKKRLTEVRREHDDGQGNYNILGMGPRIDDLRFSTGVVRPADDISAKAYFWLKLEVHMVENLLDPYA